ncbi:MAG: peptide deformylase [Bacteroidia bacterium]|nr:peptide deformylase [Bacteroidia bacterium]
MKNITRLYLTVTLLIISFFSVQSQTLKCDSIVLCLTGYDHGTIQWQQSPDSINWTDISGADTVFITVLANNNTYYRVYVSDSTCNAEYSDVIFNIRPAAFTQQEIDTIFNDTSTVAMRVMNIYLQPDSVILRTSSISIPVCDTVTVERLRARMRKTVIQQQGVGIAAPQVGILRRAVYVKRYDKPGYPFEFYLNPRIISHSDTTFLDPDGCLSVPTGGSYPQWITQTYRWIWVWVEYNQMDGTYKKEKIIHQFTSHIFQHEIDHLYGVLYFDHDGAKKLKIIASGAGTSMAIGSGNKR